MTRFIPRFLAINIRIIIVVALKRHRKIKKGKKRAFKRSWNGIITSSRWMCSSCTRTKATKKTWDAIKTEKNNRRVVTGYYRKRMCIASSCIYIYIYIGIGLWSREIEIELRCMQSFTEIRAAFYELCNERIHWWTPWREFLPRFDRL